MIFFKKKHRGSFYCQTRLQQLPYVPVKPEDYDILENPVHFRKRLLQLIAGAKSRILITVLYLQDDRSGREILEALYKAKELNPKLHISVYVDFHRAQRGLIGKGSSNGNSDLYYTMAKNCDAPPTIYGVPVKRREIFGVMHLKGCIFDDTVLYSGASFNETYLAYSGKYRLDRYHEIHSKPLADAMCNFVTSSFHLNYSVQDFSQGKVRPAKAINDEIKRFRRYLTSVQYDVRARKIHKDEIGISPLVGMGKNNNLLNKAILWLIGTSRDHLFVCTPYFNFPKAVLVVLNAALLRGVRITLVVGDKTANDFYIQPGEKFSAVGAVPYIYEQNLRHFIEDHQSYVDNGSLEIMLWQDGENSYHVKGLFVDQNYALITGNNLNPRAWALDLENGLIISDPQHLMQEKFIHEQLYLLKNTRQIKSVNELENLSDYPEEVRKLLTRVKRFKANLLIKRLL